jgi:hypothetical protein
VSASLLLLLLLLLLLMVIVTILLLLTAGCPQVCGAHRFAVPRKEHLGEHMPARFGFWGLGFGV